MIKRKVYLFVSNMNPLLVLVRDIFEFLRLRFHYHRSNGKIFQRVILEPLDSEANLPKICAGDSICFEFDGQVYLGEIQDIHQGEYELPHLLFHRPIQPCLLRHLHDANQQKYECNQEQLAHNSKNVSPYCEKNDLQNRNGTPDTNKADYSDGLPEQHLCQKISDQNNFSNTDKQGTQTEETQERRLCPKPKTYRKVSIVLYKLSTT